MTLSNPQDSEVLLKVEDLNKVYPIKKNERVKAVNQFNIELLKGEVYGLVGESGCGKTTTGKTLLRLIEPTGGKCFYKGTDIFSLKTREMQKLRKEIQMVFQDPYSSLNPKKRIGKIIEEPMNIHSIGKKQERMEKVVNLLEQVGLSKEHYYRFPHEFSGGQRQRIGLARALAVEPELIIFDEPVSALDVSVQSQILNLLRKIQKENNLSLTYLFISHDLSVVRHIADRIGVMYLGHLVEEADVDKLFTDPKHPYTKALLSSIPIPKVNHKRERIRLRGEIPSPINPPAGCVFHTRCPYVMDECKTIDPEEINTKNNHKVKCHLYN